MNEMRKLMNVAGLLLEGNPGETSMVIGQGRERIRVDYSAVSPDQQPEVERLASRIEQLQKGSVSSSFEQSRANREMIRSIVRDLQRLGAKIGYPTNR